MDEFDDFRPGRVDQPREDEDEVEADAEDATFCAATCGGSTGVDDGCSM